MFCLMDLSGHLIKASAFDSENVSEMLLAAVQIMKTPDERNILFNKGFIDMSYFFTGRYPEKKTLLLPLNKNTR